MKTELEGLKEARALIEMGWEQGVFARDMWGEEVDPLYYGAVSFCFVGAVQHVFRGPSLVRQRNNPIPASSEEEWARARLSRTLRRLPSKAPTLASFNDSVFTHKEDVLALFDAAIAECEAEVAETKLEERELVPA